MKFNLDDYDPVESRIAKFYEAHPDGRILTEMKSDPNNLTTCVFRADLYIGETLKAQGWAYEKDGEGYVNKTSHVENCETSAIGRALANAGYQGSKRPSREEMQKVQRMETLETVEQTAEKLKNAGTMADLQKAWVEAVKTWGQLDELTEIKDKRKAELGGAQ
jgi:hypothetical protein